MGFPFRLERVLSVRRIQEEAACRRHAKAADELRGRREALAESLGRLQCALEAFDVLKHTDQLSQEALQLHSLHLAGLRRGIEKARLRIAEATSELEKTRMELTEAHRAREALERLREREENAWRKRQTQLEARDLDEMAGQRHRTREEESHGP